VRLIVASSPPSDEVQGVRVTKDDVLFGYRLQLFALAADLGVSQACRLMGVHPLDVLRLEASGRPPRPGDAQATGAPPAADAESALADR
jgi:hypothetical protein